MSDEKIIHVDDDWKAQAQREKERLAQEIKDQPEPPLQEASFLGVLNMLAMQAMVGLGGFAGPGGQRIPPNPELAKHFIDLIEVLDQKTKGNLSPDEKKAIDTTLYNLRMAYVEMVSGAGGIDPAGSQPAS
jgi:hypothetical protein